MTKTHDANKHKLSIDINNNTYNYLKLKASTEGISIGKAIEKIVSEKDKEKTIDEIISKKMEEERTKTLELFKDILKDVVRDFVTKGELNEIINSINETLDDYITKDEHAKTEHQINYKKTEIEISPSKKNENKIEIPENFDLDNFLKLNKEK